MCYFHNILVFIDYMEVKVKTCNKLYDIILDIHDITLI